MSTNTSKTKPSTAPSNEPQVNPQLASTPKETYDSARNSSRGMANPSVSTRCDSSPILYHHVPSRTPAHATTSYPRTSWHHASPTRQTPPLKSATTPTITHGSQHASPRPRPTTEPHLSRAKPTPSTHRSCTVDRSTSTNSDVPTWHARRSGHCPLPDALRRPGSLWNPTTSRRRPSIYRKRLIHLHISDQKAPNHRPTSSHISIPLHVEH